MTAPADAPLRTPTVVTTRSLIRDVAERWKAQYYGPTHRDLAPTWRDALGGTAQIVYDRLRALDGETATPADVAAIIGNGSWTRLACDACQRDVGAAVRHDVADEYTFDLCAPCADAARAALAAAGEG